MDEDTEGMQRRSLVFPFSAVVDMDKLKLAILINAINPRIGGLLIKGAKGSGKSTIVRALADILPKIRVVKNCLFNCNPHDPSNMCPKCTERFREKKKVPTEEREMVVVDLPLGATEDRVVGTLDIEKAIKLGIEALEPGILAAANQNILYVDEVNLLPDHIADDLLDAAATGWNIVEREGISVSHPSRFIFIGTMNPEEGELRPQLLDRFSLSIRAKRIGSIESRMEVVKRNIEFEADPKGFYEKYRPLQEKLRNRIVQARKTLKDVVVPEDLLETICKTCSELKVDGLRPDIVIAKAASTLAAFEDRKQVELKDVLVAAELALSHRTREGGFLEPATPHEIAEAFKVNIKKAFHFEKTEETPKKKTRKRKFLKGKAIFWTKKEATKHEEQKAKNEGLLKKLRRKQLELMFQINKLLNSVFFAIGKKLRKTPKNAPATDGVQIGSKKLQGEIYEEKVQARKGKLRGIPTVNNAVKSLEISQGFPIIASLEERLVSRQSSF